jgi:hypothetical protein
MKKQNQPYLKLLCLAIILGTLFVGAPADAAASTSSSSNDNITQAVSQSYYADSSVQLGMIVQLNSKAPTYVLPLTEASINSMLGVTIAPNDATVTLTQQNPNQQQVYVATTGSYDVLVSNQDGPIAVGDLITISSLAGVGMMANQNQSIVLGKAASSFNGTSNVVGTINVKDEQGVTTQVSIGRVQVNIDITHNPLESKATDYVPSFLAKTATAISNKPVSAARIYLGMLTLLVTAIVTANMLYSGVRSGMQAIGRNPLSKKSIIRSLVQTVIAGLIIFVVGIFAVYLLLKL